MSGSFIVSGQCHARLDKVGADSYISRLTLEAKAMQNTEQVGDDPFSGQAGTKWVGVAIIPSGLFVYSGICISGRRVSIQCDVHDRGCDRNDPGRAVSACQCGACSKFDPSGHRKKYCLHDMKCIETLARVNVLCVDKTGTITENTMEVQDVDSDQGIRGR